MMDLEFNMDGIAKFATRKRNLQNVWWRGGACFSEDLVLGDDATTDDLFKAAGMDDHCVLQASMFADYDGDLARLCGKVHENIDKMTAKELRPILAKLVAGIDKIDSHRLVYREEDRKHLSVMGHDYKPVQLREAYSVLDGLVADGEITLETIGSMRDGRSSFMTAKLTGDPNEVVPGDVMDRYIVACDSYDGYSRLVFAATIVMIVCHNTWRAAMSDAKNSGKISAQKHTKGILSVDRIEDARKALGIAREQFSQYSDFGKELAAIKVSEKESDAFFRKLVLGNDSEKSIEDWSGQARRMVGELDWMYAEGPGQELDGRKGTAWGLLNGVTAYTTHMRRYKKGTDEDRVNFVLFGKGADINARAQELLRSQYQLAA